MRWDWFLEFLFVVVVVAPQKLTGEVSTIDEVDMCMSDGDDEDMNDDIDASTAGTAATTMSEIGAAAAAPAAGGGGGGAQSGRDDGSPAAVETVGFGGSLAAGGGKEPEKAARCVCVSGFVFGGVFAFAVFGIGGPVLHATALSGGGDGGIGAVFAKPAFSLRNRRPASSSKQMVQPPPLPSRELRTIFFAAKCALRPRQQQQGEATPESARAETPRGSGSGSRSGGDGEKDTTKKAEKKRRWDEDSDSDDDDDDRGGGAFSNFFSYDPPQVAAQKANVNVSVGGSSIGGSGGGGSGGSSGRGGVSSGSGIGKSSSGKGKGGGDVKRRKKTEQSSPQHALSVGATTLGGGRGFCLEAFLVLLAFVLVLVHVATTSARGQEGFRRIDRLG